MRLTAASGTKSIRAVDIERVPVWVLPLIGAAFGGIFLLDNSTGTSPVQHLYYLPILLAARFFRYRGGFTAAIAAVILYHLANGALFRHSYHEADIIQICLFIAVGTVTAKLVTDAQRLQVLATTDDLTGLHNLRSFESQLVNLVRASRRNNSPLSLMVLDVDHLKQLNDKNGHLAGAEAVRSVGQIIARVIPPDAVACRYGGDEFAVVMPGCVRRRAEEIASELRQVVYATEPILLGSKWPAGTISVSVGVACGWFDDASSAPSLEQDEQIGESLFRAADQALYRAKDSGRNRVCAVQIISGG